MCAQSRVCLQDQRSSRSRIALMSFARGKIRLKTVRRERIERQTCPWLSAVCAMNITDMISASTSKSFSFQMFSLSLSLPRFILCFARSFVLFAIDDENEYTLSKFFSRFLLSISCLCCSSHLAYHSAFVFSFSLSLSANTDPSHDDNQTIPRARQSLTGIDSDERKTPTSTAGMFQANYHYTPLKEYAATRSTRPINETPTTSNGYQRKFTQRDVSSKSSFESMQVKERLIRRKDQPNDNRDQQRDLLLSLSNRHFIIE